MSETTNNSMSTFTRWILGLAAIVFFPLTITLIAFYIILYKIPVFVGMIVEEIINGVYEKWSGE